MSRRPPPAIDGMHSLKVDNISYNTTQADLRRLFDKYGDIGDIHIPRDKYSRQSRGFAFVRFYNRRDCEYAQERTDGRWMDGRELRVSVARYERVIDDRGGRNRSRSRSPRRRSRTRSPRYSRSRSRSNRRSRSHSPRRDRSKSRDRSPSRSRSRSPSRHSDRKSASPARSRSPTPKSNRSRSASRENSRSPSPRD